MRMRDIRASERHFRVFEIVRMRDIRAFGSHFRVLDTLRMGDIRVFTLQTERLVGENSPHAQHPGTARPLPGTARVAHALCCLKATLHPGTEVAPCGYRAAGACAVL